MDDYSCECTPGFEDRNCTESKYWHKKSHFGFTLILEPLTIMFIPLTPRGMYGRLHWIMMMMTMMMMTICFLVFLFYKMTIQPWWSFRLIVHPKVRLNCCDSFTRSFFGFNFNESFIPKTCLLISSYAAISNLTMWNFSNKRYILPTRRFEVLSVKCGNGSAALLLWNPNQLMLEL